MAGTITTTLISGEPVVKEGKANEVIYPGDVIEHKSGSLGTLQQFTRGGTTHDLMVARETGSVDVDGSYKVDERVEYLKLNSGDRAYVNVSATKDANGAIDETDILAGAAEQDGALANNGVGAGNVARAEDSLGTPASGTTSTKMIVEVL